MKKIPLLVLAGPTGIGKSDLAVALAKRLNGEIVGADSMQVYDHLQVGTARVTESEMQGVPHHLVGFLNPKEDFSVARYLPMADAAIYEIHKKGKLPILCGGTGLYISSLLDHLTFFEVSGDPEVRAKIAEEYDAFGGEKLWARLASADAKAAEQIHPNNKQRLVRALELLAVTGKSITAQNAASHQQESPYDAHCYALDYADKAAYWAGLRLRVDRMFENGLLEEAKWLFDYAPNATATQAIAYKECFPYLMGKEDEATCKEKLTIATRQYAKRQKTWLRRDGRFLFVPTDGSAESQRKISENISKSMASGSKL